ncbi:MAG: N4-gp56 family major capsid protein [Ruminococcaceae bacterium]|nr:N4-gp56 family major capsid protein [Oscillospiraceae bacterium]
MNTYKLNLQHFAEPNTNVTTDSGLSVEMKTLYDDALIDEASPMLVHDQFGQKRPIPKGKGKKIEFRKYASLPKATTPLTEGVTPNGSKLSVTAIEAEVTLNIL